MSMYDTQYLILDIPHNLIILKWFFIFKTYKMNNIKSL